MDIKTNEITTQVQQLILDPNNRRLSHSMNPVRHSNKAAVILKEDTALALRNIRGIEFLESSIQTNGFMDIERIFVKKVSNTSDDYIVIDGNRKVLILQANKVPDKEIKVTLIEGSSSDIEEYSIILSGLMHLSASGAKKYDGIQEGLLINDLFKYHSLNEIGKKLVISTRSVKQKLYAFKALEQMQKATKGVGINPPHHYLLFREVFFRKKEHYLLWDSLGMAFEDEEGFNILCNKIAINPRKKSGIKTPTDMIEQITNLKNS